MLSLGIVEHISPAVVFFILGFIVGIPGLIATWFARKGLPPLLFAVIVATLIAGAFTPWPSPGARFPDGRIFFVWVPGWSICALFRQMTFADWIWYFPIPISFGVSFYFVRRIMAKARGLRKQTE